MDTPTASLLRARGLRPHCVLLGLWLGLLAPLTAQTTDPVSLDDQAVAQEVRQWMGTAALPQPSQGIRRVEVVPGRLDPRLRLAPCARVEPHLPPGARLWGATRVGLRCVQGKVPWNVYLPVTVKVWGPALVATRPLAQGSVLVAGDLRLEEVDIAADASPVLTTLEQTVGQRLNGALNTGQALRQSQLQKRLWFAAGDAVRVTARGEGFAVSQQGLALTPGIEGQATRVRTENGKVIVAMPDGAGSATVLLTPR